SAIHTMTVTAPAISPATAPVPDMRFQVSDNTIIGPKAAPKPAQAWLTKANTFDSGSRAMIAATTPTKITLIRPILTHCASVAFLFKKIRYASSVNDEDDTNN